MRFAREKFGPSNSVVRSLIVVLCFAMFLLKPIQGFTSATASSGESCECQEIQCGACEAQTGTSFYTAKCGQGLSRVKSCKKPTCEAVENQPLCLAKLKSQNATQVATTASATDSSSDSRAPASAPVAAGEVAEFSGSVRVLRLRGSSESVRSGLPVYEGDTLETLGDGKLRVTLKDGSDINLPANSRVRVDQVSISNEKDEAKVSRKIALNLLVGKVRSRVTKKYEGDNFFRIKTRTAVAGVRGTDFVASFEPGAKEWITEVRTLEGKVQLGAAGSAESKSPQVEVPAGTYAAYIVESPPKAAEDSEIDAAAGKGFLTPVFKMKEDEMKLLRDTTELRPAEVIRKETSARAAAADSNEVCLEPAGKFNQCSYTCIGNPKGEKKCRTDLQGVSCVRHLCRANGLWAEPSRMPSSQSDFCVPEAPVVRDCAAYW